MRPWRQTHGEGRGGEDKTQGESVQPRGGVSQQSRSHQPPCGRAVSRSADCISPQLSKDPQDTLATCSESTFGGLEEMGVLASQLGAPTSSLFLALLACPSFPYMTCIRLVNILHALWAAFVALD